MSKEFHAMHAKWQDSVLQIEWCCYDCEEFGGTDMIKTFRIYPESAKKLLAALGNDCPKEAAALTDYLQSRFGSNYYSGDFAAFCREHAIHYSWHEYEDYPGGISRSGSV